MVGGGKSVESGELELREVAEWCASGGGVARARRRVGAREAVCEKPAESGELELREVAGGVRVVYDNPVTRGGFVTLRSSRLGTSPHINRLCVARRLRPIGIPRD